MSNRKSARSLQRSFRSPIAESITVKLFAQINVLNAKYNFTPEEIQDINKLGFELCRKEYDEPTARLYFSSPNTEGTTIQKH